MKCFIKNDLEIKYLYTLNQKMICQCCQIEFKHNNILELEWRQYCKHCFVNKGNHEFDIVIDYVKNNNYPVYKIVKKKHRCMFMSDE